MRGSSLECYQLLLLSLRLLPSFFLICFGAVVLLFRADIGLTKTKLDLMAQWLTKDYSNINGVDLGGPLFWTTVGLVCFLLSVALQVILVVLLQLAGLERPAFIMQFYPNYLSHKLKRRRAASQTTTAIYVVGVISFVVSLAIGLCICLSARGEITQVKKSNLAESIRTAMLVYKLRPWRGVNRTKSIDNIQTSFSCCGLNSYHDYALEPRKKGVSWERHFFDRSVAAAAAGLSVGQHLAIEPPAQSCCLKADTGELLNCTAGGLGAADEDSGGGASFGAKNASSDGNIDEGSSRSILKLHRIGCFIRVLQYIQHRQAEAEYWSFLVGACIVVMGTMAYWAQAM